MNETGPAISSRRSTDGPVRRREASGAGHARFRVSEELFVDCRDELYEIASRCVDYARDGGPMQPTELLHEAYLVLMERRPGQSFSEHEFRCYIATVMRNLLCSAARRQMALKRGGRWTNSGVDPDELAGAGHDAAAAMVIDEAMHALEASDPRCARVAELKVFGALTTEQIAEWLGVSSRTVQLDWRYARAWLTHALKDEPR